MLIRIAVSLVPVLAFVLLLSILDSYKLVKLRATLSAILAGSIAAGVCFLISHETVSRWSGDVSWYVRYAGPFLEELAKGSYLVILARRQKIGFMVDAAILGAATGAGFAAVENIYYLYTISDPNPLTWVVRGFGTAVMHAGTTAILGIVAIALLRHPRSSFLPFLSGFGVAFVLHSAFNHFVLPPLLSTCFLLLTLPLLVVFTFWQSEKSLGKWLGVGFDTDVRLLQTILSGEVLKTKIGEYLTSLEQHFPGEILADLLCMLRLHLELSIKAKGLLIMREAGFFVPPGPEISEMFTELQYLEKSIGPTGKLALAPILHNSSRDLWQFHFLESGRRRLD